MMLRATVFFAVCAVLAISAHGQRRGPMGGGRFEGGRPDGSRFGGRPDGGRPEGRPDGSRFGGRPEGRPEFGMRIPDFERGNGPMGGRRFDGGRPDGGRFGGRPDGGRPQGRPDGGRFGGRPEGRPESGMRIPDFERGNGPMGGRRFDGGRPDGGRFGGRPDGGRPEGRPDGGRFGGRPEGRPESGMRMPDFERGNGPMGGRRFDGGRPDGDRFGGRPEGRPEAGMGRPDFPRGNGPMEGRPSGGPPRFGKPFFGQGGRGMDTDSEDGRRGPPFNFDELDRRHHGHHHQHHHHRHHHNGIHNHTEHGQEGEEGNWDTDFPFRRHGPFGRPPFWRRNDSDGEVPDRRGPHHHGQHHHGHEHHHHGHRRHNRTTDGEEMPEGCPFRFGLGGPGRDIMEGRRPFGRPGGPGPRGFRGPHRPHGPHGNRGGFPFGGRGEGRGDRYDGEQPEVEIPTTFATPEAEIVGIEDNGIDTDIANELN